MGRLYISGPQSTQFLDWVLTGSADNLAVGRARYCMICNESGGVIDDTIFYRLASDRYLLIPNAGNRNEVVAWFQRWIDEKFSGGCAMDDRTRDTVLLAFQGPGAPEALDRLCQLNGDDPPSSLHLFAWGEGQFQGKPVFVGRTGYTGEDGFEMVVDADDAQALWNALLDLGALPCGLGARDVLRLEAALPLHGHEIDPTITPIEAGLGRFVRDEGPYIGWETLRKQREEGTERQLVGLKLAGRSAPRAEYPILNQGEPVGIVTSGSYSPTLDTSIAMGYVLVRHAAPGQWLDVDIRGRITPAEVVELPFYTRPRRRRGPARSSGG
jgi:aminomethyltransferase